MTARLVSCVVAIAIAGVPAAGYRRQETQTQVFRSSTNAVSVDVTVQDKTRKSITNLKAGDFEVYDNGVLQEVADASYGRLPIDVTIALDVSFSVTGVMLERLRRGVVQLMRDLGKQDRLKLMLFNSRVARTVDFTDNESVVETAIKTAEAGGGTSLFDAISVALVTPAAADRRHLLVVFTDGNDSTSTTPPNMLSGIAIRSRATMTFVVPGGATLTVNSAGVRTTTIGVSPNSQLFGSLAATTGGTVVPIAANTDLSAIFKQVLTGFRSAYVLLYNARGVDRGGFHTLEVKVKKKDAIVVSRRGYWY